MVRSMLAGPVLWTLFADHYGVVKWTASAILALDLRRAKLGGTASGAFCVA